MPTTTSYGNWNNRVEQYSLSLDDSVETALNGEYTDEEVAAVTQAYRDAINAALPASVDLCGSEFYGYAYEADCADQADYPKDENGSLDLAAIVEGIDFWDIVASVTN